MFIDIPSGFNEGFETLVTIFGILIAAFVVLLVICVAVYKRDQAAPVCPTCGQMILTGPPKRG
jgi:hypothetical protein